jgi:ectoine hydroxylase-related dioxygenase (phytanoyl-CoA dioxygenase family)
MAVQTDAAKPEYFAGQKLSETALQQWVDDFHRDGYLFLKGVLPPNLCEQLRSDLDAALAKKNDLEPGTMQIQERMFEQSEANLSLFDLEPMVSFAERVLSEDCHVIHNNSFITPPAASPFSWHQDDPPHYLVTEGEAPKNVHLPPLLFTCNYYLSDVTDPANGPTSTIPKSHLFGKPCPQILEGTEYEALVSHNLGPAGSVCIFNNQVWHTGSQNTSDRTRYITQVSYARRVIGHKYYPFMNYTMPEHCYAQADARRKRLLGFLPRGAYG